jgi:UDP-N-acetylmuramoylalanine--D-glutamate ligase
LLNLTPDHLDRHGTMQHYADIKERLVAGAKTAVIGVDDSYSTLIADRVERTGVKVRRISKRNAVADGIYAETTRLIEMNGGVSSALVDLDGIPTLKGSHNAQNAAAAIAACLAVGVSADDIRAGLRSFPGLKHRMQPVGRRDHVVFVNDSKATNAEAAAPALSSYERIYWIAGGLPKEGGIASLAPLFQNITKVYLIGEAAPAFAATLGDTVPYEISGTLERAVTHAAADAAADTVSSAVMLSPACASFDQFKNFEVRGDAFVALVAALDSVDMLVDTGKGN